MDTYDIRRLFDAVGKLADNTDAQQEHTQTVAQELENIGGILDSALSQLNNNLGRIADALETERNVPPWEDAS